MHKNRSLDIFTPLQAKKQRNSSASRMKLLPSKVFWGHILGLVIISPLFELLIPLILRSISTFPTRETAGHWENRGNCSAETRVD